ncbi:hypothetical protein LR004_02330, partial [Candidatus Gracilibacteria bacterium]|nr:hypothetical protein [Candidatus Gracilibacteria bacterium]
MPETIHKKTINNAISAYLMLLISGAFLFNKDNEYLNNSFVKSHTKIAFLIHISFLINYVIFISFSFLKEYSILEYSINYILASSIFCILFLALLYGIYKASRSEVFKISDFLTLGKTEKIVDVDGDAQLDEKDKLTLILAQIPFVGYIIHGKFLNQKSVKDIVFLNMLVTVIIVIIYILGYTNVALLFMLGYIIFGVFASINILVNDTIIGVKLDFLPNPEEKITLTKSFFKYLKNYSSGKEFIGITQLKEEQRAKRRNEEAFNSKILEDKKDVAFPKALIYLPIINLFTLKFLDTKQRFHIINGTIITLLLIIILVLNYFYILPSTFALLLLFPITFGLGYIDSRPAYKMPYIYEIYETLIKIKNIFKK